MVALLRRRTLLVELGSRIIVGTTRPFVREHLSMDVLLEGTTIIVTAIYGALCCGVFTPATTILRVFFFDVLVCVLAGCGAVKFANWCGQRRYYGLSYYCCDFRVRFAGVCFGFFCP